MDGWQRRYRLSNGLGGLGVTCTAEGLALAGVPLLAKGANGFQVRPGGDVSVLLKCAYGPAEPNAAVLLPGLSKIADALNQGDLVQAMIRAVHLRLTELDWDAAVRVAQANNKLAKFDPAQPRDWHGCWTTGSGSAGSTDQSHMPRNRQSAPVFPWGDVNNPTNQKVVPIDSALKLPISDSPQQAPEWIMSSPELQAKYEMLWRGSFPDGSPREMGGTIVSDIFGNLSVVNIGGIRSDDSTFEPNLNLGLLAPFYDVEGTTHTHPYGTPRRGNRGVSFSDADSNYLILEPIKFSVVQSGEKQFMFLKTRETASVFAPANFPFQDRGTNGLHALGMDFGEASRVLAAKAAEKYGFAYYEGSNGLFRRVYP
ncbi:hypothetical protein [Nitrospirillum sp. BR 11163]|uniref:hypothetical protein n=1 Tax=Nitrospirillum sp. BR 11163 TaxID=3104323 RepID=UPI002AFFE3D7|nr:hypothetical protein [Nitrospirillum sp. BR 11163]MEA1676182.1 hypothetical protein [Nitrospirillum sp. BR 11163]